MKVMQYIFVGFFLAMISLPGTLWWLDVQPENIENRVLTSRPSLKEDSLEQYIHKTDQYVSDHLPLRDVSYTSTAFINWTVLHSSVKPELTIPGKQHWMYYTGENVLDDVTQRRYFTRHELDSLERILAVRAQHFNQEGIRYIVIFVPNKHRMESRYMPPIHRQTNHPSRFEQLDSILRTVSHLEYIPLTDELNKTSYAYYKTDTHWSLLGGYLGTTAIARKMSTPLPVLDSLVAERYSGDLTKMLGLHHLLFEYTLHPTIRAKAVQLEAVGYLPQDHPRKEYGERKYSTGNSALDNAVVFHDSYGKALFPYLPELFNNTTFLWDQHINQDVIEQENAKVVIHVVVERYADRLLWP